ncbi:enoyl-CoA hydratase/isomerase family protein [Paraburkholderia phymatum]|nr:enoyl-CoA hydratase-related protein [Paraburkholderia phymatum]
MMSLDVTVDDSVASVVINRPEKLNALDLAAFGQIGRLVDEFNENDGIRAVIFRGTGTKAFSAGADISELKDITVEQASEQARFRQGVLQKLSEMRQPTVAVINGLALGGGVELALACTFRIATPDARIGLPEVKLGQLPGAGGTQRLPRLIGEARALDMMLTGRLVNAEEALGFGLVTRIIQDPLVEINSFIAQFLAHSPVALRAIRDAVRFSELPIVEGLKAEVERLAELNKSYDAAEGKRAFLEKRPPVFLGK